MKPLAVFLIGAVTGYAALLLGWLAYSACFDVFDRGGVTTMSIEFFAAPVAAVVIGVYAMIHLGEVEPIGRATE